MKQARIIEFPRDRRKRRSKKKRARLNAGRKGRVYSRGGKLWVDFRYLGERVREPSGLDDTAVNRLTVRRQLDLVMAEIETGNFEFAARFPHSSKKEHFSQLEGRIVTKDPKDVLFRDYVERWWKEMEPGMSLSQVRDYTTIIDCHLMPYFGKLPLSEFRTVLMKKFVAYLQGRKNQQGKPLSAKRIHNVMIPLRVIVRDAIDEYGWTHFPNPFSSLKLPRVRRLKIHPFGFEEWATLMKFILPWYRPYFELAVQTGLRPSEQVALKWSAVDHEYIHIELSRVRNVEKSDLKTEGSVRRIEIRPSMRKVLQAQRELTAGFESPYVFLNLEGRPILQDKLRELWARAMEKSGIPYRRMYETRHTFASWALAAGESPEWVARTLGHVNSAMVYKTYGRYIPNLTRQDGSAFERQYAGAGDEKVDTFGHNWAQFWAQSPKLGQYNPSNYLN
jgi:integrase